MGKFWDEFRTAAGDQVRGGMKYGFSTSAGHNARAMKAARAERESRLGQEATDRTLGSAYREAKKQRGKRDIQFEQDGYIVRVTNGRDRRTNKYTTDIIIIDPEDRTGHWHFVVDEFGTELINEWRLNH